MGTASVNNWVMYTLKSENKYFENIFNSFLNKKG
jgi:hypothetical protein